MPEIDPLDRLELEYALGSCPDCHVTVVFADSDRPDADIHATVTHQHGCPGLDAHLAAIEANPLFSEPEP